MFPVVLLKLMERHWCFDQKQATHLNVIQPHLLPTHPELVLKAHPQYFYTVNHVTQFIHSQKARRVCLTGIWRWNVKGSWCVKLEVCTSTESLPAKYNKHQSMVFPLQLTLLFWLIDCFSCFLHISAAFVNAWHRRLFRTFRQLFYTLHLIFFNLCSTS